MFLTSKHILKCPRKMRNIPVKALSENVVPDYFNAYQTFLCSYAELTKTCIETMVVPPAYEQVHIINHIKELTKVTDISGFEGAIMRLLIIRDTHTIDVLVQNLQTYNNAKQMIDLIMDHVREINLTLEKIS